MKAPGDEGVGGVSVDALVGATEGETPVDAHEAARSVGGGKARRAARERLDTLLVERGLAPSRERARALIMAHEAQVDGRIVEKAGTQVARDAVIALVGAAAELRYVSRGGLKLERALDTFGLDPAGLVCVDVGASTGGFTDVLLRRGATRVFALDVGHGQLAWALRTDPRVVVMDRTNIRHVTTLPETPTCAVVDVSFISLRLVLPHVAALLAPEATSWVVALVKPQFEAGRAEADRGAGVIRDPRAHLRVLRELVAGVRASEVAGPRLAPLAVIPSPITGRDGNREYLLWLGWSPPEQVVGGRVDDEMIEETVADAFALR